ncbi:MAG: DUF1501 domain-containing protein [Planctomycetia bacterium]|nr:DUF1501 domain-containing protein [Planctomycetia bacterium]
MNRQFCDGIARRDVLRIGAASLVGMPMTLSGLLAAEAKSGTEGQRRAKAKSFIYVFLKGGLSTIDTFDMKPNAPSEFAGDFRPIDSNVPGIQVGEHIPRISKQMDKLALIRSFNQKSSDHGAADHYMLTGYFPQAGFNGGLSPNNHFPSFGSIVAQSLGARGSVPPYVCLPRAAASGGSAYLGASAAPFTIEADPSAPRFSVPDVVPPLNIAADRLEARHAMLAKIDRFQKAGEVRANAQAGATSEFRRRAFDLMTSPAAKQAFDIHAEPAALRDAYGRHTLGQSCLMARRLVEAGVRCVTIDHHNWDTHDNNFNVLKTDLLPKLDSALSTLLEDLATRGLLDSTLVVISGEFGRTPRINKNAGRDHWGPVYTVMMAGGGIKGGRVEGKSDSRAEKPADLPHGPEDLGATICTLMGIDPEAEFHTPEGRPIKIVNSGKPITPLM